jgi:hypothetical protein
MPAQEDGCRAGAKPCPTAKDKQKKLKANRNLGGTTKTSGERDSDNHVSLGAQIPIHATLTGSNCCQALGTTVRGYAPVLDLCRALVKAGHDPRRPLHSYRGDVLALKVRSIGEGARFTVREDRAGPRFVAWEPFPRRVGARVREKAEGIAVVPLTSPTNPARHPAQRFEPQQNLYPTLTAVRSAHDEQAQKTIRQNSPSAARDRSRSSNTGAMARRPSIGHHEPHAG